MSFLRTCLADHRRLVLLLVGATLLTILGCKVSLIQRYGSDLPFWDQWDAEGDILYAKVQRGDLTAADLVAPHNEHRILFTRLLALALFKLNGHWDARLQTLANTLIHLAGIGTFLLTLGPRLNRRAFAGFCVVAALSFGLPFTAENTISGFQSQFYFLLLFTALYLAGALLHPFGSWRWTLAHAAGACGLLSMGSGFLAPSAVLAGLAVRWLSARRLDRGSLATGGGAVILVVCGLLLMAPNPAHDALKAQGVGEFVSALSTIIAWPSPWVPAGIVGVALPWIAYLARLLRTRDWGELDLFVLALGGWCILQAAAVAYSRANGMVLSPRYLDIFVFGVVTTLLVWLRLLQQTSGPRRLLVAGFVGWLGLIAAGYQHQTSNIHLHYLDPLVSIIDRRTDHVRALVASGAPRFPAVTPYVDIPYPNAERLAGLLGREDIRRILPFSVRPPVALKTQGGNRGFTSGQLPSGPVAPPPGVSVWHNYGALEAKASFESTPLPPPPARFLRFLVQGDLDGRLGRLVLRTRSGEQAVTPEGTGKRWRSVVVDAPREPYQIVAEAAPGVRFAFSSPVELPFGSWLSRHLVKTGMVATWLGAVSLAVLVLMTWLDRGRSVLGALAACLLLASFTAWAGATGAGFAPGTQLLVTSLSAYITAWLCLGIALSTVLPRAEVMVGQSKGAGLCLAIAGVALAGYAAFWLFFAHPFLGRAAVHGGILGCLWHHWHARETLSTRLRASEAGWPLALMFLAGLAYLGLLHLQPLRATTEELAAVRFTWPLPMDNRLPRIFAEKLITGEPLKPFVGDWLSSDRPPLQTGLTLFARTAGDLVRLPGAEVGQAAGMWFQLCWIPAVWLCGRVMGLTPRRTAVLILLCAASGFFLINTVYVWPKLSAAALMLSAFVFAREFAHTERALPLPLLFVFLAWLAHGGVAFSALALAPFLWRWATPFTRPAVVRAVVLFLLLVLPWLAYQNVFDPPGDRLLKWHLADVIPVDDRSFVQALRDRYAEVGLAGAIDRRWLNFRYTVGSHWHALLTFGEEYRLRRQAQQFYCALQVYWFWLLAVPALALSWRHRRRSLRGSFELALFGWCALTYVVWIALLFGSAVNVTAMIHHGSYAMVIGGFVLLLGAALRAPAWFWVPLAGLNLVSFVLTWIQAHEPAPVSLPALLLGMGAVAGLLEVARRTPHISTS